MGIQKIKLTSTVYSKKGIDMIAGPSSNEGPDGWVWDKNKIANRLIPTTLHEKYAGGIDYNLDEGVSILDWNNFAFEDIQLSKINEISFNGVDLWNPNFTAGTYFLYGKKINLYSDYSVAGIAEEAEKEECYSFELNEKFKLDSLSLSIYKRSFNNVKFPYLSWEYSSSKKGRFFNVEGNLCKTNNNEKVKIGLNTFKSKEIKSTWEHKGSSRKEGRYLFSEYFPIKKGSLKVYAIRENKIVIFNESEEFLSEKMEFRCDYDLGIIETSGKKHREVYSKNFIKETATSIEISPEENLKSWPLQGEVQIGEEIVYYQNKSKNKIYGCLRGFKNTQAKEINIGEKISLNQKSSGLGEEYDLYISYEAVPRYEYEVEDRRVRRGNKLGYLDLHPYSNLKNNGIIQLSTVDTNVASLELEIDAENIGGNVFGPAYFGIDHKFITARAKDSLGNEIEGIEISVHINGNSPGYFSGNTKRYVDISNNEGEIYTAYTCPYDWEEISKEVYKVEHKNNESILTIEPIEDLQSFDKESITIYEVLKDDPVFGYNGIKFEIIDSGNDFDLDGKVYLKSWIKVYGKKMNFVDSFSNSKLSIEWHDGGQSTS